MDDLIEIKSYDRKGYKPLIDFGSWRVAILRWEEASLPVNIRSMERHTETDEVFVLLEGKATLILGGKGALVDCIYPQVMEIGKVYNIKQQVWHTAMLSQDASILIVENQDTGVENSEYCMLSEKQKKDLLEIGV
jgi:ureidoglycolate hydrolase